MLGMPCAAIIYALAVAEMERTVHYWPPLRKIGDASYSLYLSHFLVMSLASRITALVFRPLALPDEVWFDNVVFILAAIPGSVVFALLSLRFIEGPMYRLSRRLIARQDKKPG